MARSGGYVGRGAALARRDWPGLAWLYLSNLVLAALASTALSAEFGSVLNTSLEAQRLARGFDAAVFLDLLLRPEVTPRLLAPASLFFAIAFALVTLFLTPGIVQGFLSGEHLRMGAFFQACGRWYGRFFWFAVLTLPVFGIVLGVLSLARDALLSWAEKSPEPRLYFYVGLGTLLVMWVAAVVLRLWFDLTQFALVHSGRFWRSIATGIRLLRQGCFRLLWIYCSISLLGWLGLAAGLWLWVKLPPERVGLAFLLGQAILIVWLGTRYWQRAAEALWFREHAPALLPAAAVPVPMEPAPGPLPASPATPQ
ncbi:MAG TPA: hypothetical protein VLT85_13105 [Terriglobales bacterium]|nr:hypothetical protein [Terriglobales bacterium]